MSSSSLYFSGTTAAVTVMTATGAMVGVSAAAIAPSAVLGLTAGSWTIVGLATGVGTGALSLALDISSEEAEKVAKQIQTFLNEAEKIGPGETFTYDSTLSMTRTVYVMNENGEIADHTAWTGPTDGSDLRCVKLNDIYEINGLIALVSITATISRNTSPSNLTRLRKFE